MKGWSRNKQVGTTSSLRPRDLHLVLQQEVQTPRVTGLALAGLCAPAGPWERHVSGSHSCIPIFKSFQRSFPW